MGWRADYIGKSPGDEPIGLQQSSPVVERHLMRMVAGEHPQPHTDRASGQQTNCRRLKQVGVENIYPVTAHPASQLVSRLRVLCPLLGSKCERRNANLLEPCMEPTPAAQRTNI